VDDSIEEGWLLRQNLPEKDLEKSHYIFGMKVWSTYQHKASTFYVKPLAASVSEIKEIKQSALGELLQSEHEAEFKKTILGMNERAQWEIQKLLESRDTASSNDIIKRSWEVVAFQTQPRRKINQPIKKKWWNKGKKPMVEWVLVLKGETVDRQKRVMPVKHENPWERKEDKKRTTVAAPAKNGDVLAHVEKRNFMSMEEAESKMRIMLVDLFTP
jgi:hypothetical protein